MRPRVCYTVHVTMRVEELVGFYLAGGSFPAFFILDLFSCETWSTVPHEEDHSPTLHPHKR